MSFLWAKDKHTSFGIFLKNSLKVGPLKLPTLENSPGHICYMYLVSLWWIPHLPLLFKSWAFFPCNCLVLLRYSAFVRLPNEWVFEQLRTTLKYHIPIVVIFGRGKHFLMFIQISYPVSSWQQNDSNSVNSVRKKINPMGSFVPQKIQVISILN